jgi:hypothetical protein
MGVGGAGPRPAAGSQPARDDLAKRPTRPLQAGGLPHCLPGLSSISLREERAKKHFCLPRQDSSRRLWTPDKGVETSLDPAGKSACATLASERELECRLHESRRGSFHHLTEQICAEVGVHRRRPEELRVVESVESLQPELQRLGLRQPE